MPLYTNKGGRTRQLSFTDVTGMPDPVDRENKQIIATATNILGHTLTEYGNAPGITQMEALRKLIQTYTELSNGKRTGRYAFPLAVGGGKTCSIIAWVTSLARHHSNISVAVSASRVEALCDLKRALNESFRRHKCILSVGLWHTYSYKKTLALEYLQGHRSELPEGYASEPSDKIEDLSKKQILLITHARVRQGERNLDQFNVYQGQPRDLLIYDESLLISDTRGVSLVELQRGVGYLLPGIENTNGTRREAVKYIQKAVELFEDELKAQKEENREPKPIRLLELRPDQIRAYREAIRKTKRLDTKELTSLLTFSQQPLRVIGVNQGGGGFISYDLVVDPSLDKITILDASHVIRELTSVGNNLRLVPECKRFGVTYHNLTIKHLQHGSGRGPMTKSFENPKRENRKISLEICEAIKKIPEDEGILIFTFKPRKRVNFREVLESDLQAAGIDTNEEIEYVREIDGHRRQIKAPRFVWLTWGNETSYSRFSYCKHVILAGVLHRSDIDLASAIAGQMDDLLAHIPNSMVDSVKRSEAAHCIYQAAARGHIRVIRSGIAGDMTLYLIHWDRNIREILDPVLPDANWQTWETKYIQNQTKVEEIGRKILEYLEGSPEDVKKMSTYQIKKDLSLNDIPHKTFNRAIHFTCSATQDWMLQGRSMVRSFQALFPEN